MSRFYLILIALILNTLTLNAQDTLTFPEAWQGIWQGDLEIHTSEGLMQIIPMELHILPTDSMHRFTWTLIYGEDKVAGARAYELVIIDAEKGIYAIDEKNSIQMESYFFKDKFFSRFEVMGTILLTSEQLVGENLIFEIIAGSLEPISTSGDQVVEGDTIPPVQTFPINVMQRAMLKRQ